MVNIVFDLDGTLVDSVPSLCAAANAVLAQIGRPSVDLQTYKGFVGRGWAVQLECALNHTGGIPDGGLPPLMVAFRTYYTAHVLDHTHPYDSVIDVLTRLNADGHALGVCTQKEVTPARKILQSLGMMPPVSALTGGDSIEGCLKPDPHMLAHTLAQMPKGPVVYVGDSETDAQTALNAQVPFLLHTGGYRKTAVADIPHDAAFDDWSAFHAALAQVL